MGRVSSTAQRAARKSLFTGPRKPIEDTLGTAALCATEAGQNSRLHNQLGLHGIDLSHGEKLTDTLHQILGPIYLVVENCLAQAIDEPIG